MKTITSKDGPTVEIMTETERLTFAIAKEFALLGVPWSKGITIKRSKAIAVQLASTGADWTDNELAITAACLGFLAATDRA